MPCSTGKCESGVGKDVKYATASWMQNDKASTFVVNFSPITHSNNVHSITPVRSKNLLFSMMKLFKDQINTLFSLLFLSSVVICLLSFTSPVFAEDEIVYWKSGLYSFFKYEKQDSNKFGQNDHPVELDEKEISTALTALEFTEKKLLTGETIKSVFNISQLNLLGKQLAKGLKNAKPGQDIIFVLVGNSPKLLLLNQSYFIAGRAFFKDGKLNMIIGDYWLLRNNELERTFDPGDNRAVSYDLNFGSRSKQSNKFKGTMITVPGFENKKTAKKFRYDWFILDVELAAKAYLAEREAIMNPRSRDDKQLQIEAAKLSRERREMRAEMARMRKEMKEINSGTGTSSKTPEERIATLDQLLTKELITQEEYDIRREEILNDI